MKKPETWNDTCTSSLDATRYLTRGGPATPASALPGETMQAAGTFFLVVGPSGVGKDSLMDGARAALLTDPRYVFARRVITRPTGSPGEDHEGATEAEF